MPEPLPRLPVVAFIPDVDDARRWLAVTTDCPGCGGPHVWTAAHVDGPLRAYCGAVVAFDVPGGMPEFDLWTPRGVWGDFPEPEAPKAAPVKPAPTPPAPVLSRRLPAVPRRRARGFAVGLLDRWGE